ncbi:MAG TPA: outer membrane beta-barrel protein [Polyangiaceae bacterium]|nr:outer membrane beta-barrel protein [Polyangiaceae bacterium]
MKFCLTLAATALLGAFAAQAHAQAQQPWLADRRYGEGIGIRTGNLELHPGVAAEVGYDSNYFLRAKEEDPLSAFRIRITPSITLSTLGMQRREGTGSQPTKVMFRGGAYVSYNELIATESKHQSEFADQRHLDVGADALLNIFPVGRVGGDTYLNFIRQGQPSNNPDTENAFDRDSFRAGAGITWRPGGGLFDWRIGGEFLYNYFEKTNFRYLNNFQYGVNMRGRWRFLPRTALLYDGSYTWVNYPNPSAQNDGAIARSSIGLNGLITSRLALLAMVGWAGTFYDQQANQSPQQFDSITAQAELKWYISGGTTVMTPSSAPVGLSFASIGYLRDVSNSYLGNFYQRDRGYVSLSYLLGGAFVTGVTLGFANLHFPDSYFPNGGGVQQPAFSEQRLDATVFGEYRFSNQFGLNATFNYDQNFTDVVVPTDPAHTPPGDYLAYSRWQIFIGARYFW